MTNVIERIYEVAVPGYGAAWISAKSSAAARYKAFDCDAFGLMSFKDFLKLGVTARLLSYTPGPGEDGYDYVRQEYGVDVRIGQVVRLKRSGGQTGQVVYPGATSAYVRVALGDRTVNVHPSEVEIIPDTASRPPIMEQLMEFYEPDEIGEWMRSPHPQLGGKTAAEVMATGDFEALHEIIDRLDSGVHL